MAPTDKYPPGQLVWVKTRGNIIDYEYANDPHFDPTPKRKECQIGLIIRGVTYDEVEMYTVPPTARLVFILEREKALLYQERFIHPLDTFPLEEDD